jgi:chromate reductase
VIKVLALTGSLRKGSFNNALCRAAQALCPDGMSIEQHPPLSDLPYYDDDVRLAGYPASVQALRDAIASADAILFATPEYNYSVPGMLKNAIDWVSRPPAQPFAGKPAGVISGSIGLLGGARMQYQLRQMAVAVDLRFLVKPELLVPRIGDKFDAELKLTDEDTKQQLRAYLEALLAWTKQLKAPA